MDLVQIGLRGFIALIILVGGYFLFFGSMNDSNQSNWTTDISTITNAASKSYPARPYTTRPQPLNITPELVQKGVVPASFVASDDNVDFTTPWRGTWRTFIENNRINLVFTGMKRDVCLGVAGAFRLQPRVRFVSIGQNGAAPAANAIDLDTIPAANMQAALTDMARDNCQDNNTNQFAIVIP